jgi:hypothetical protein
MPQVPTPDATPSHAAALARRGLGLLLLALALQLPGEARAWKPTTHAYLADIAVQDALDDGQVSIAVLSTGGSRTYPVDPAVLQALREGHPQYRAGVLGPDAYPDIATGQMTIHPDPQESGVAGGSNAWLEHIWRSFDGTPQERAFRLGFLTHAAGDMYGHTFINHFTGAPFTMSPPQNAIKHVVLEGYIDTRLPAQALGGDFFNASIAGLEGRIYSAMVDARPGTLLGTTLMPPDAAGGSYSVPRIFSTMRAGLQRDIDAYYAYKADLQRRISACGALDFSCSAVMMGAELAAFVAVNGPIVTYKEYWRDDIDEGLRLWPSTSHAVAQALFFNPQRRTDVASADAILTQYAEGHLLSMAGAPDVIGISIQTVQAIIAAITPDFLLVPLRALKEELLNTMLKAAIGMDKQQLHDYMTRPDLYFDQVMTAGAGEQVTLARFNADYLRINDPGFTNPDLSFDFRNVPAAYNTVVLSKLILLSPQSIDMLVASLGGQVQLHEPNIMLGFIRTLDGSRQWRSGAFIAEDCAFYDAIFMAIPGEGRCAN